MQENSSSLIPSGHRRIALGEFAIHPLVAEYGAAGRFAWEEFFSGSIRNLHTRKAYLHAVRAFLGWCELAEIELRNVTPGMIGRYFDEHPGSPPTKKLHMSAIRGFLDVLVLRHVIILNPALSVRTERFSSIEGKTPEITVEQARTLRESIKLNTVVDVRDRAIISTLIYTAARVGAVAKLRIADLTDEGHRMSIRFREKGGKHRVIPARTDLQDDLEQYLRLSAIYDIEPNGPLFRSAAGRAATLKTDPMSPVDICRMVKRRLAAANLPTSISPHSFRACAATDLLKQGVAIDDVQYLLSHSDSRTTALYDRRKRVVSRNIVERISV
jgi:site-specific recombinase XerD